MPYYVCLKKKDADSSTPSESSTQPEIIHLPHPRTHTPACYLLEPSNGNQRLYELQRTVSDYNSWFIHNSHIEEDGSLITMTPFDPVFMLLAVFELRFGMQDFAQDKFLTKEDLLYLESWVQLSRLDEVAGIDEALKTVCEHKDIGGGMLVYKFSKDLAVKYVKKKASRLVAKYASLKMLQQVNQKELFLKGDEKDLILELRTKAALSFIFEYLSPKFQKHVLAAYEYKDLTPPSTDVILQGQDTKYAQDTLISPTTYAQQRTGAGGVDKDDESNKKRKTGPISKGQQALAKVNKKGMKPLTSFFTKKT